MVFFFVPRMEAKIFPITRQSLRKLCGLAGQIYGSHMRRKNAATEKKQPKKTKQKRLYSFSFVRVCEKGSNTLQPPESPFGLDQFILNEVFIRGIFIQPGLYYKGNIRLRVNPANVFPIVSEPTHEFYCKIKIMLFFKPCCLIKHPWPQNIEEILPDFLHLLPTLWALNSEIPLVPHSYAVQYSQIAICPCSFLPHVVKFSSSCSRRTKLFECPLCPCGMF